MEAIQPFGDDSLEDKYVCVVLGQEIIRPDERKLRLAAQAIVDLEGNAKETYHVAIRRNGRATSQMALSRDTRGKS